MVGALAKKLEAGACSSSAGNHRAYLTYIYKHRVVYSSRQKYEYLKKNILQKNNKHIP